MKYSNYGLPQNRSKQPKAKPVKTFFCPLCHGESQGGTAWYLCFQNFILCQACAEKGANGETVLMEGEDHCFQCQATGTQAVTGPPDATEFHICTGCCAKAAAYYQTPPPTTEGLPA